MGSFLTRSAAAGVALCLGALCAAEGHAQSRPQRGEAPKAQGPDNLGEILLKGRNDRRPSGPPVARYVVEGSVSFVLDRSTPLPLIRFEGSNEIWVLYPQPASRGDILYKNEVGEPVLRASGLGGLTVFTASQPQGAEAAVTAREASLRLPPIANKFLINMHLTAAMDRALRAVGQGLDFEAPAFDERDASFIIDATNIMAEAFENLAKSEKTRTALRRVKVVKLFAGEASSVRFDGSQLTITVAPRKNFAGRPSSAAIARAIRSSR